MSPPAIIGGHARGELPIIPSRRNPFQEGARLWAVDGTILAGIVGNASTPGAQHALGQIGVAYIGKGKGHAVIVRRVLRGTGHIGHFFPCCRGFSKASSFQNIGAPIENVAAQTEDDAIPIAAKDLGVCRLIGSVEPATQRFAKFSIEVIQRLKAGLAD